jgi:hypothetical protein
MPDPTSPRWRISDRDTNVPSRQLATRLRQATNLQVSPYDRVSALLMATLILVSSATLLLSLIWLGQTFAMPSTQPRVVLTGASESDEDPPPGPMSCEVDEPNADELSVVPPLMDLTQSLVGLTTPSPLLERLAEADTRGGDGTGNDNVKRRKGPNRIAESPPSAWELQFPATTIEDYARQLDFFGMELAVVGGGKSDIEYARAFTATMPVARTGNGADESRRYLLWRKGPLVEADRALLTRAGIVHEGRVILKFVPGDVERQMALLENEQAKSARRAPRDVTKTVFAIVGAPGSYQFVVADQRYRF